MIDQALSRVDGYLSDAQASVREARAYPRPICRLEVDGRDITAAIEQRLVSIELTDNRGLTADQLDVTLSDHDGRLAIPPKGATLRLWLGWSDIGLVDKGTYTVDETEHSGAPDQLNIRARSVDLSAGLKAKRERSWHAETIETVVQAIAGAYGLGPLVSAALSAIQIVHLDQANESDANLLSRLGQEHDAIATVKAGKLLFMPIGNGTSASGLALPHITLTRRDGDQHRFLQADRDSYTGVRAFYYDVNSAEKKEAISGGGDNIKDLRHSYTDQKSALVAARAEWNKLQRGSLRQNRFEARCAVGHRYQVAIRVIQTNFANPLAAFISRNHLLGDDHCSVDRVDLELVQRPATPFVDQAGLCRAWDRVGAVGISHTHLSELPRNAERVGVRLLGHPHVREDREKLRVRINHNKRPGYLWNVRGPPRRGSR